MEQQNTKYANEVAKKLNEEYRKENGCGFAEIRIYRGTPDARYKKAYWAIAKSLDSVECPGLYGTVLRRSTSIKGLLMKESEETAPNMNI